MPRRFCAWKQHHFCVVHLIEHCGNSERHVDGLAARDRYRRAGAGRQPDGQACGCCPVRDLQGVSQSTDLDWHGLPQSAGVFTGYRYTCQRSGTLSGGQVHCRIFSHNEKKLDRRRHPFHS